jgi:hypothetical protein
MRDVAVIATVRTVRVGLAISLESAKAAPAPACGEVTGIIIGFVQSLKAVGQFEEGAEEGCAIIVYQLDQSGLLHQAAEFDKMAGAGPAILYPLAGIVAGAGEIEPIALHGQTLELSCRCLQVLQHDHRLWSSSRAWRLAERTPVHVRSTSRRFRAGF